MDEFLSILFIKDCRQLVKICLHGILKIFVVMVTLTELSSVLKEDESKSEPDMSCTPGDRTLPIEVVEEAVGSQIDLTPIDCYLL